MSDDWRSGPPELRAAQVVGVSHPRRTIDLVVIPYDEPTVVQHRGRAVTESIAAGAFDGIERRPNRVRVNYHHQDHELHHILGHAETFHPKRPEGLVATIRMRKGEVQDDALAAAADGELGASAGFWVLPDGETWPDRNTRRLTKLWLDHIALTPTPAYPGAQVLAVRSSTPRPGSTTPNLDVVREMLAADRLAVLESQLSLHR